MPFIRHHILRPKYHKSIDTEKCGGILRWRRVLVRIVVSLCTCIALSTTFLAAQSNDQQPDTSVTTTSTNTVDSTADSPSPRMVLTKEDSLSIDHANYLDSLVYISEFKNTSSRVVHARLMTDSLRNAYIQNEDFDYKRIQPLGVSLYERIKSWLLDRFISFLESLTGNPYKALGYVFLVIALCLFVWFIMKAQGTLFLSRRSITLSDIDAEIEDIATLDIDALLQKAIQSNEYRSAMRYVFLKELKHIAEQGVIRWTQGTTNRQYALLLPQIDIRPLFYSLMNEYECVWYGDFPANQGNFTQMQEQAVQFRLLVNVHLQKKDSTTNVAIPHHNKNDIRYDVLVPVNTDTSTNKGVSNE